MLSSLILAAMVGQTPDVTVYEYRQPRYEVVQPAPEVRTRVVREVVTPPPVVRRSEETVRVTVSEVPTVEVPTVVLPSFAVPVVPLPDPLFGIGRGGYKYRYRERVRFGR